MNEIDRKYVGIVSLHLDKFVMKSNTPYRANFRCNVCGDSQKSKTKARGWFLENKNHLNFYCHNCGASMGFRNYLKSMFPSLYDDYVVDSALDKPQHKPLESKFNFKKPKFELKGNPLSKLKKISQLEHFHPAKKYVEQRKIPVNQHYRLYYAPEFNKWTNTMIPDKMDESNDEPRLVIPFIDKNGVMFGYQGRSFKKDTNMRYITIMLDKDKSRVFGLDKVNLNEKYYIVEGPIDSLFLSNAIAMAGSDSRVDKVSSIYNAIYVFDMEPRNYEIVRKMNVKIMQGCKVAMLPYDKLYKYGKDINDFILSGLKKEDIENLIDEHIYSGLDAELQLGRWSKL